MVADGFIHFLNSYLSSSMQHHVCITQRPHAARLCKSQSMCSSPHPHFWPCTAWLTSTLYIRSCVFYNVLSAPLHDSQTILWVSLGHHHLCLSPICSPQLLFLVPPWLSHPWPPVINCWLIIALLQLCFFHPHSNQHSYTRKAFTLFLQS